MATTTEIIFSPVEHKGKDLDKSPIWKSAYHPDDMTDQVKAKYKKWFKYHIKFEGLKPMQITKTEVI